MCSVPVGTRVAPHLSPARGAKVCSAATFCSVGLVFGHRVGAFTGQLYTMRKGHVTDAAGADDDDVTWCAAWGEAGWKEVGQVMQHWATCFKSH